MNISQRHRLGDEFGDSIVDWVQENLAPADVFNDEQLKEWATNNGFVLESKAARDEEAAYDHGFEAGREAAAS